jgi:hypothetical protein
MLVLHTQLPGCVPLKRQPENIHRVPTQGLSRK